MEGEDADLAIKLEEKDERAHPQLLNEWMSYKKLEGARGVPKCIWFGEEGGYYILVLPLLGPSLHDLFTFQKQRFTLKTTLLLADQIFDCIEHVHSKGILHRDLKPANFVIGSLQGSKDKTSVYILDFGLARPYRYPEPPHQHIPYKDHISVTGTPRFASINNHLGREQSRRDDLESIMYMLIYFVLGKLPWQNLKKTKDRMKKHRILAHKKQEHAERLCEDLPVEFNTALKYCKGLEFEADPDYSFLRNLFKDLYLRKEYKSNALDWAGKKLIGFYDASADDSSEDDADDQMRIQPSPAPSPTAAERQRKRSLILLKGSGPEKRSKPLASPGLSHVGLSASTSMPSDLKLSASSEQSTNLPLRRSVSTQSFLTVSRQQVCTGAADPTRCTKPESAHENDTSSTKRAATETTRAKEAGADGAESNDRPLEASSRPSPSETYISEDLKDCYSAFFS